MPPPRGLPIVDHHCHLSPRGEGLEAARRFERAGGTELFLTTQQYEELPPASLDGYERQFATTERLAHEIESATSLRVHVVVAPFPLDLLAVAPRLGLAGAVELQVGALELAGRWAKERRAVALGEVGRPHFPIEPELRLACDGVFRRALEVAKDSDVPAVVHSEDLDAAGFRGLAELAESVGLPAGRLVKHYARTFVPSEGRAGIAASYLARRALVAQALGSSGSGAWFLETDFLDDPRRPGAVLDLATIPRRVVQLLGPDDSEGASFRVPFVDSVRAVYGFTPGVDR